MSERTWEDLPATHRDVLLAVARHDRENSPATREALTDAVDSMHLDSVLDDLAGSALVTHVTDQPEYTLSANGADLLAQHYARLSSVAGTHSSHEAVAVPYCSQCGTALTLVSPHEETRVPATPCGCHLAASDDDPLYDTLTQALERTADPDARVHLRQALQLAIARDRQ